jgi:arginine kinase
MVGPHLNSANDLSGMPIFPAGTKSLLCKHLSRDIFGDLKDKKDACGFDFQSAIFSGCKNVDSGIGVYAGSKDSYNVFAPLFDRIIEDYHGHKKTDMHPAENPKVVLNAPDFPPDEAKMIMSTRIRVGRNWDEIPLGPGLFNNQDRTRMRDYAVEAFNKFDGEFSGKYYDLESLSDAERKQLIDDHFLFKEGDRFLDACGLNRDWPKNRGIFHNKDKTFLIWVNEEDQFRIISMQPGANIKQVFERLCTGLAKIEKTIKFSFDPHLGYITSCPTNLGTAMRASVHIHLPHLGNRMNKAEFEAIADKYNVQIRGAHGEHTETDDGIFDISNKRRLGITMTSLVQDMYDGVKAMIKREKELAAVANKPAAAGSVKCGPHLKKPEDINGFPEFPAGTTSLVSKYLTKDVYNKYKGKKDKAGVSFE